ncbi:MAG: alpha/beta hydrolase [Acidobacteriota bacterium]
MTIEGWKARGTYHSIEGHSVFVVDTGADGDSERPTVVLLHGYPTSSHDFYRVIEDLAGAYRVIVHDHLGFGLSDKPRDYSYSLLEQTDVALLVWRRLGVRSAHVVAHDYGTSVATELLARWNRGFRPVALESMTLCNGSVHIELAKLRPIQKLLRNRTVGPWVARLTSQRVFNHNMRRLWFDPDTLTQDDLDIMWQLLTRDGGRVVLPRISQYLRDRVLYWHRWVGALQRSGLPLAFLWGAEDPIVGADVAAVHHAEAPGSRLTVLDEVGHYPMLEAPARWTGALLHHFAQWSRSTAVPNESRVLGQKQIVGKRLVAVLQTLEDDGRIHHAGHCFVLDDGVVFSFPSGPQPEFLARDVPNDTEELGCVAVGATIQNVYRYGGELFEPDDVVLKMSSGHWISQLSSAPEGVHFSVGLSVDEEPPDELEEEYVEFWAE